MPAVHRQRNPNMAISLSFRRRVTLRNYSAYSLLLFFLCCLFYICITNTNSFEREIRTNMLEHNGRLGLPGLTLTESQYSERVGGNQPKETNGNHIDIRSEGDFFDGLSLSGKLRGILRHGEPDKTNAQQNKDYPHGKNYETGHSESNTQTVPDEKFVNINHQFMTSVPNEHRIPRIIHQTWENLAIPGQVKQWVQSWRHKHPDWEYWFWTDRGSRHMIHDQFPTPVLSMYADYPYNINRADVRKLLVLYQYGGIFSDLDVESLLPVDNLLSHYQCIIAQEPLEHQALLYEYKHSKYVMPAFIACRPKHPFLKFVIDALPRYANRALTLSWNDNVLKSTGPMFLSEVLDQYLNHSSYKGLQEEYVHIAPSEWFMPTFDSINMETYVKICSNISTVPSNQREVCEKLKARDFDNTPSKEAFTNHHWLHSWGYGFVPKGHLSIEEVMSNFTILDS